MKENLYEYLAGNEYPGRGICVGLAPGGKKVMMAYFIPTLTANAVFLKKTSIISMKVSVSFRKCSEQNSLLI